MNLRGTPEGTSVASAVESVVELRFLVDPALGARDYTMEATSVPASDSTLKIDGLRAAPDGYLRVYLPAKQMIGKTWVIRLGGGSPGYKNEQTYRVQFNAASPPSG
jgi:hypothetical protein